MTSMALCIKLKQTNRLLLIVFVMVLNINLPDGTSFTINEEEDWNAVKEWYESNPDTEEELSLEYPVEVKLEDGEVLTINNEEEMEALKEDCD